MINEITIDADPSWLLSDATFEKMGALMAENGGRLLGLYDEMSAFLTKIKLAVGLLIPTNWRCFWNSIMQIPGQGQRVSCLQKGLNNHGCQ